MLCLMNRKIIIGIFGFIFSVLLPVFLSSVSYATSVTCPDFSGTSSYNFSSCDTSSLDSSKIWYYSADFTITSAPNYSNFVIGSPSSTVYPFSHLLFTIVSARLPITNKFIVNDFGNANRFTAIFDNTAEFSVTNFTISDELGSADCPDCPDCPPVPEIPTNPYDEKFDDIKKAIYLVGTIPMIIYFFWCMYGIIIKNSGVK